MNEDKLNNEILKCNKGMIKLSNNSTITAYSGADSSNIEGVTCDVIILDEAQKDQLDDILKQVQNIDVVRAYCSYGWRD